MITFSEIETTTKRASKAAGFSWGVAEEIGKSIRSLELFGLPGIISLNQYLKMIKKKHPSKITKIEKENKNADREFCPIYSGVAFLDRCLELEKLKSLKFYNVNYPLLMLSFISRASESMSKRIFVQFDNSSFLLNFIRFGSRAVLLAEFHHDSAWLRSQKPKSNLIQIETQTFI